MAQQIDSYRIGKIRVSITESDENPQKLTVDCNDGTYHSEFTVSRYEYQNYKRHMNQKILLAYQRAHREEGEAGEESSS